MQYSGTGGRDPLFKADELKAIEKALLGVLTSDAKYAGKQYVCRELSLVGTDQSVPVLAKMLTDEKLSDMARYALEHCAEDLGLFSRFVDKGLHERLEFVVERPFVRVSYTEAVKILQESGRSFEFPVEHGHNLQSEHERFLTEEHFKSPATVFNYPREIKPFYMRLNDDGRTVTAMDVLVPGIGEVIGGAQREERLEQLRENMKFHRLKPEDYWWYTDLRRYGTVPHAGFGVGFERLLMFLTGVPNIRDVIPFARTPGNAEF